MREKGPLVSIPPFNDELERQVLGQAMLLRPLPSWLAPEHFVAGWNATVLRTIRELEPDCSLPRVAARIRAERRNLTLELLGGKKSTSEDLMHMAQEAAFAERMGWNVDVEELRELADRRALLATLERVTVTVRRGDVPVAWALETARSELAKLCFGRSGK
jgi:hypothetical protein